MLTRNSNIKMRNTFSLNVYQKQPSTSLINESTCTHNTGVLKLLKLDKTAVASATADISYKQIDFIFSLNHTKRDGLSKNTSRLPLYKQTFCIQESGLTFINA